MGFEFVYKSICAQAERPIVPATRDREREKSHITVESMSLPKRLRHMDSFHSTSRRRPIYLSCSMK